MNRRISLVAAGIVVALVVGWYVALWRPSAAHLHTAKVATAKARQQQTSLETHLAGLVALERRLPAEEAVLAKAAPELPTSVAVDKVIDQINAAAVATNVAWTNESQAVSAPTAVPTTSKTVAAAPSGEEVLTLTLDVAGTYAQVGAFITDLEHLPRLLVVDSLGFATQSGSGLHVSISGRAFYDPTPIPAAPKVATSSS